MTRAWTLGYPPVYDRLVTVEGNGKAPAGYIFPTIEAAIEHRDTHADACHYAPYEVRIDGPYEAAVTRSLREAHEARHAWHQRDDGDDRGIPYMDACYICTGEWPAWEADHDLLLVTAPFVAHAIAR